MYTTALSSRTYFFNSTIIHNQISRIIVFSSFHARYFAIPSSLFPTNLALNSNLYRTSNEFHPTIDITHPNSQPLYIQLHSSLKPLVAPCSVPSRKPSAGPSSVPSLITKYAAHLLPIVRAIGYSKRCAKFDAAGSSQFRPVQHSIG